MKMNKVKEAMKTLKEFCIDHTDCDLCPLFRNGTESCLIMYDAPYQWYIED